MTNHTKKLFATAILLAAGISACTSPLGRLNESIKSGDRAKVIRALAEVDCAKLKLTPQDDDPLITACLEVKPAIIRLLLDAGAPIICKEGEAAPTAVSCALHPVTYPTSRGYDSPQDAERDSLKILQILHEHGARCKSTGKVLDLFSHVQPTLPIVRFMVKEMGLNPVQNWDKAEECPIRTVAGCGGRPEVMAYMLQQGRIPQSRKETLLLDTLNGSNGVMLDFFFKQGSTPSTLVTAENGEKVTVKEYVLRRDRKLQAAGSMHLSPCVDVIEKWEKAHGR